MQALQFTVLQDPSIRIRRAAMQMLTSVTAARGSSRERQLLQLLACKCRDKDMTVRQTSYSMLTQVPMQSLVACIGSSGLRSLLDVALLATPVHHGDDAPAIKQHGLKLLTMYVQEIGTTSTPIDQKLSALQLAWGHNDVYAAYMQALVTSLETADVVL